jgi:hypothetical protein
MATILTGEKVQQLCDIYLGFPEDFLYNPIIARQGSKHCHLQRLATPFSNPPTVFCYSHHIELLSEKIDLFLNPFILVTHNSDNIVDDRLEVQRILASPNLKKWYAQNLCYQHDKLVLLPIGYANSRWAHGNMVLFNDARFMSDSSLLNKSLDVYFHFNIITSKIKRDVCYNALSYKLPWLPMLSPVDNLNRLKNYRFCICPEGNGVDTHRLWEALYLRVVPIVLNTPFSRILKSYGVPLLILDQWSDLDINSLNYTDYDFTNETFLRISTFTGHYLFDH